MSLPKLTKDISSEDFIMIVQDGCIKIISYEDFIKDISLGGFSICKSVLNCWENMGEFDDQSSQPSDTPPKFTDVITNLKNRTQGYVIPTDDFLNNYYDADGDDFSKVIITGGDLSGVKFKQQPVYIGLVISVEELGELSYDAKDIDKAYQQVIDIEVYDENNIKAI
ncbi:hypothetical protein PG616_11880 [Riemerella anatipestifer]|nr:hypothetical protein [Riemerella anatipestifer]